MALSPVKYQERRRRGGGEGRSGRREAVVTIAISYGGGGGEEKRKTGREVVVTSAYMALSPVQYQWEEEENKSSKDRTWSAVPDALLGVIN